MTASRHEIEAALDAANQRLVALLRGLPAAAGTRQAPACPGWTAAEVAAHVLTVYRRALGDRRRSATPEETAALNEICLGEVPERDLGALADLLAVDGPAGFAVLRSFPADLSFRFHGGTRTTVVPVSAAILAEILIHGRDLAEATGAEWVIPATDALLVLEGLGEPGPDGGPSIFHAWLAPGGEQLVSAAVASDEPVTVLTTVFHRTPPSTPALHALAGTLRPL